MKASLKLRVILVAAVAFAGIILTLPSTAVYNRLPFGLRRVLPSREINLGLDLRGGTHLVLEIDSEAAFVETVMNYGADARRLLAAEGIRVDEVVMDEEDFRKGVIRLQEAGSQAEAYRLL